MKRTILTCAFVAACAASQAFQINIVSVGTFIPGINYSAAENIVFQNTPANLTSLAVSGVVINPGPAQFLTGSAAYTGAGQSLNINFISTPVSTGSGGTAAYAGTWNYVSGTGVYANLVGSGSWTVVFNANTNNYSNHSFSGELTAVPEPSTMAVLGVAGLGLITRRRRNK